MRWFRRKKEAKNSQKPTSTSKVDVGYEPVRPYRLSSGLTSIKPLFLVTLIVLVSGVLVFSGLVYSDTFNFLQSEWASPEPDSVTTLPASDWSEYSAKDAGVVAEDEIQLERTVYTVTQTSGDGMFDACATEGCSAGTGLNGTTAVKNDTAIFGTGQDASVKLDTVITSTDWSQQLIGTYDTHDAVGIDLAENMVYIADDSHGLKIFDVTVPSSPTLAGTYNTPGQALGVAVSGDYAYVAGKTNGLHIINVASPAVPTLTATYNTPGKALGVAISGDHAYVADENKGLRIVNIATPSLPTSAAVYDFDSSVLGVAVSENYAYVAEDETGLQILNIAVPSSPVLAGSFATSATPNGGIGIIGDYVYVTQASGGFQIIDVSTPSAPVSVEVFITTSVVNNLFIVGNTAYMAMSATGLVAFDLSVPSSPVLLGTYNTAGIAKDVFAAGNTVYIADGGSGLQVLEVVQASEYSASGTYESTVIDLGSDIYKLTTIASDTVIPADSMPVGVEISSLDSGLMALWHMNSGSSSANAIEDAAGSHNGSLNALPGGTNTATADMWDSGGKLGSETYNALKFDGTDDYMGAGYVGAGIQTVMFWINHANPLSGDEILELSVSRYITIEGSTGEITATGFGAPAIYIDGSADSPALSPGWHHVAVVSSTGLLASSVNLGRVGTGYMTGKLDEVALFSRAVTPQEIRDIYAGSGIKFQIAASDCYNGADKAPKCSSKAGWGDSDTPFVGPDGTVNTYFEGPLALLHFNEGAGTSAQDVSGHGSNGVIIIGNNGIQAGPSQAWAGGVSGDLVNLGNQGLSLDGADDYVSVGNITQGIKTVEFWINHSSPASGDGIMELDPDHTVTIKKGTGNIQATGFDSPTIYVDGSADSTALTTGWHHVAVVTDTAVSTSTVDLGRVGNDYLKGVLDEVVIYNRALTQSDVLVRYNDGLGREGAVFGGLSGAGLDNKQFLKYKAALSTASLLSGPQMRDVTIGYSAFPMGAGLVSSILDTEDDGSFLKNISWFEMLDGNDARVQVATSGDGKQWNYCGKAACSTVDWLDFTEMEDNYYTDSAGSVLNIKSRDAINDRYVKYKVWLMSSDGDGTPAVDDVAIVYDTAHLEVFAGDGSSATYTAEAGKAFNIVVTAKDSSGKLLKDHDGSKTVKLTASVPQADIEACRSSFTGKENKDLTVNANFTSGKAVIRDVMLCDDTVEGPTVISAMEITGGVLRSTDDLTILDITESPEDEVSATLTWDSNQNCGGFDHYEVWYDTDYGVDLGIGKEWDNSNDPALVFCSTTSTTITRLKADTEYYFKLFAIDENGNATAMDITTNTMDEGSETEDAQEEVGVVGEIARYEVLVKLGDNHSSDPTEDARGSYKHGDVVVVKPAGHNWSDTERNSFLIVPMKMTQQQAAQLTAVKIDTKRRSKRIKVEQLGISRAESKNMRKINEAERLMKNTPVNAAEVIEAR